MEPYLKTIQGVALKVLQFHVENSVHLPGMMHEARSIIPEQSERLIMQLRVTLLGEDVPSQILKVPANWWEHFKERFFPPALKEIWPVEYTCYLISFQATYPDFKPKLPDHRLHLGHTIRVEGPKSTAWYKKLHVTE